MSSDCRLLGNSPRSSVDASASEATDDSRAAVAASLTRLTWRIRQLQRQRDAAELGARSLAGESARARRLLGNEATHQLLGSEATHQLLGNEATHRLLGNDKRHQLLGNDRTHQLLGNDRTHQLLGNDRTHQLLGNDRTHQFLGNDRTHQLLGNEATPKLPGNARTLQLLGNENTQRCRLLSDEATRRYSPVAKATSPRPVASPSNELAARSRDIEAKCAALEQQLRRLQLAPNARTRTPDRQRRRWRQPPFVGAGRSARSHNLAANLQTVLALLNSRPAARQSPGNGDADGDGRREARELLLLLHADLLDMTRRYARLAARLAEAGDDGESIAEKMELLAARIRDKDAQIRKFELISDELQQLRA